MGRRRRLPRRRLPRRRLQRLQRRLTKLRRLRKLLRRPTRPRRGPTRKRRRMPRPKRRPTRLQLKRSTRKTLLKQSKRRLRSISKRNSATATLEVPAGFWAVTSHVAQQTVCQRNGIVWTPSASVSTDCAQRVASATMLSPANLVAAKKNKKKMLLK